jgi:hypothetical protein
MATFKAILVLLGIFSLAACNTGRDTSGMSNMGSSGSSGSAETSGNYIFGGTAGDWTRPASGPDQSESSGK